MKIKALNDLGGVYDSRFYGNINSYFYKYDDEKDYVIFDMIEYNPITVKQL